MFTGNDQKEKNFSEREIALLLDVIEGYIQIIENKKTDEVTWKEKACIWEKYTIDFNSCSGGPPRTVQQSRKFYGNFKEKLEKNWLMIR
ncbi:myb/sant-like dna-binding domain [Holotrichia oblita]|uniref:Myb/sant-like dna-binding domain n=1 Tax=Holotrichia oblita TaxID=644536 RepID=A0ACB9SMI2_HOLOL|nr:myb/sant-like dna-binding domain [Holotrichia oblita]